VWRTKPGPQWTRSQPCGPSDVRMIRPEPRTASDWAWDTAGPPTRIAGPAADTQMTGEQTRLPTHRSSWGASSDLHCPCHTCACDGGDLRAHRGDRERNHGVLSKSTVVTLYALRDKHPHLFLTHLLAYRRHQLQVPIFSRIALGGKFSSRPARPPRRHSTPQRRTQWCPYLEG
jgi:hypothetical protein